jgi:hypothetical protein
MKTKNIIRLSVALILAGMLTSCSSTYQTASSFGKRKYLKGNFNDNAGSAEKVAASNSTVSPSTATSSVVSDAPSTEILRNSAKSNITNPGMPAAANANTVEKKSIAPSVKKAYDVTKTGAPTLETSVSPQGSSGSYAPENLASVTNVQSYSGNSKGGMFDFKDHLARTIIFIILFLLIIGLIIFLIALGATPTVSVGD